MADNVQFQATQLATPASGTQISTDEASSGHIQRVKLAYSANGSDTQVQADADGLLVNTGAHLDDVSNPMALTDQGIGTKSAIFGYTTSGGGSFEPVKVTPSGALTVEVSDGGGSITVDGTVAATQSGTWNVGITGNVALPAGASTEYSLALAGSNLAAVTNGSNLRVGGFVDARQTGAWTVGVAGTVPVTDNSGSLTVDAPVATPVFVRLSDGSAAISTLPVSLASVPSHAVTNAGTFAVQAAQSGTWNVGITGTPALAANAATEFSLATHGSNFAAVKSGSNLLTLAYATQAGTWNLNNIAGTISLPTGAATETSLAKIALAASSSNLLVSEVNANPVRSSLAAVGTVTSSASTVTLLAANANRKGWSVFNDSTAICYVKFGATASTTSFTVRLDPYAFYESGPAVYGGQVDAIWASANGAARTTEW